MQPTFSDIQNKVKNLSKEQFDWRIPEDIYEAVETCSFELEKLYELQTERLIKHREEIADFLDDDPYFQSSFQEEATRLNTGIQIIDHFHVGVKGYDHVFFHEANKAGIFGVESSLVDHFFDPDTNIFKSHMDPLPPIIYRGIGSDGKMYAAGEAFDRKDLTSMKLNYFRGINSPRAEQRERFEELHQRLSWYYENEDDLQPSGNWDDPENEPILSNLEEVKSARGRPAQSERDDCIYLTTAKVFMMRYVGNEETPVPKRHPTLNAVAKLYEVEEHNLPSFLKRLDRKLKRKMAIRGL